MSSNNKIPQNLLYLSVLALLASFILVIFVIIPKATTLKSLSNEASSKENQLTAGKDQIASLREAITLIQTAKKDVELLGVAVPAKANAEEALAQISANAQGASVQLKNVTVSGEENGNLKISVSILGKYSDTVLFMKNLETNLRPVTVNDLAISSGTDGSLLISTFNLLFPYLNNADETSQTGVTNGQ